MISLILLNNLKVYGLDCKENSASTYSSSRSRFTWPRSGFSNEPLISYTQSYEFPNKRATEELNEMYKISNPLGIKDGTRCLPGLDYDTTDHHTDTDYIIGSRPISLLTEDGDNLLQLAEDEPELMNFIRVLQNSTLPLLDDYIGHQNSQFQANTNKLSEDERTNLKRIGMTEWDDLVPRAFDFGISIMPPLFYLQQALLKLDNRLQGMVFDMMKTKLRSLDVAITSAESLTNEYFIGIVQQILNSSKKIKVIL